MTKPLERRAKARSPRVTVKVTPDILSAAQVRNSSHCMIAEAMQAALPDAKGVAADIQTCRFTDPKKNIRYSYLTPRKVQQAIIAFDQGVLKTEGFEFHLEGGQVHRAKIGRKIKREAAEAGQELPFNRERESIPKRATVRVYRGKTTVIGGQPPPQMSTRRQFGVRQFDR